MSRHYVEFRTHYEDDFLKCSPAIFGCGQEECSNFCLGDTYGSLYYIGKENDKPIYYFRHSNPNSFRFGGFVELGDDYLMPQKGGYHHSDIAQIDAKIKGYRKISSCPLTYGFESEEPFSEYRFYDDHATFKEGDFFEVNATPLPITIVDHGCIFPPMNQVSQPCLLEGTYEGKKVIGLGSYDRYFMPKSIKTDFAENLGYICASGIGQRDDGRYEVMIATINDNGTKCGIYWLEGNDPIYANDVKFAADWVHLPYVSDGTCIYQKAVISFAGIEIHITGKWGTKGFTKEPRIERHGQSQVFGTWYTGNSLYRHKLSNSFFENMNCFDYRLIDKGYRVIE